MKLIPLRPLVHSRCLPPSCCRPTHQQCISRRYSRSLCRQLTSSPHLLMTPIRLLHQPRLHTGRMSKQLATRTRPCFAPLVLACAHPSCYVPTHLGASLETWWHWACSDPQRGFRANALLRAGGRGAQQTTWNGAMLCLKREGGEGQQTTRLSAKEDTPTPQGGYATERRERRRRQNLDLEHRA